MVDTPQLPAPHLSVIAEKSFRTREMGRSIGWNYHGWPSVKQQEDLRCLFDKCIEEHKDGVNYYSTPNDVKNFKTKMKQCSM